MLTDRAIAIFEKNPLAWLGLAAFLFAEYNLYQRGSELTQVCLLVSNYVDFDTVPSRPETESDKAAKICRDRFAEPEPDYYSD